MIWQGAIGNQSKKVLFDFDNSNYHRTDNERRVLKIVKHFL